MSHLPWYFYLIGILGLALLMVVHESGHYLIARAFGLRVVTFSIGFGPTFFKVEPRDGYFWFTTAAGKVRLRLWKHDAERHGPTVFQVAMIPFFAYVKIAGMNPFEDVDEGDKGSYANAGLPARILTIFGGPASNYLFASVLFFAAFFFGGRMVHSTEVKVIEGRAAAAANIKTGDKIVEINGVHVSEWKEMADVIAANAGVAIPVVVERAGERITLTVTPKLDQGRGMIGVGVVDPGHRVSVTPGQAAELAVKTPVMVVKDQVEGFGQFITGKAEGQFTGPAGIVKETARAANGGWTELLYFLGVLSAILGAFNLIPFPALDGGRLMFLGYEATTRRRPNARIEAHIHAIGLMMMLGLTAYVTIVNDLRSKGPEGASSAMPSGSAAPSVEPSAAPSAEPSAAPGGK